MRTLRQLSVIAAGVLTGIAPYAFAADTDSQRSSPRESMSQRRGTADAAIDAVAVTTQFTVEKIDPATRTVTLKDADGTTRDLKCGPEVRNFDQIKQGDQVRASIVEELAVEVGPKGQPGAGERQMVAVAPKGAKPGMVMVQTDEITAKVLAVDPRKRMVSLEGPSGTDKTIKVSKKVDLDQIKKGETVTLQIAQAMAILVQSPEESAQPSGATMPPKDTP